MQVVAGPVLTLDKVKPVRECRMRNIVQERENPSLLFLFLRDCTSIHSIPALTLLSRQLARQSLLCLCLRAHRLCHCSNTLHINDSNGLANELNMKPFLYFTCSAPALTWRSAAKVFQLLLTHSFCPILQ